MGREKILKCSVSDEELDRVERAAKRKGKTMAEYMRDIVLPRAALDLDEAPLPSSPDDTSSIQSSKGSLPTDEEVLLELLVKKYLGGRAKAK